MSADEVSIVMLEAGNQSLLHCIDEDVFDHSLQQTLIDQFIEDDRHHMALAVQNDTVIGMASAVNYVHPDKADELWINELGVASHSRRNGIGTRLLVALLDHGRMLGCRQVWVATEPDNTAATALYQSLHGEAEDCVIYSYTLSEDNTDESHT